VRTELGIWPVRVEAQKLGEVLAQRLGGELLRPWKGVDPQAAQSGVAQAGMAQSPGARSQKERFQEQFSQRSQWVLVMATGIATRFVDGLLHDKHQDPAVVVLDEAGRYAVALVSGHEGGANALAYQVANAVGAIPVVTTATEATKPLVIGIGCRKGVSEEQIERAVRHALARRGPAERVAVNGSGETDNVAGESVAGEGAAGENAAGEGAADENAAGESAAGESAADENAAGESAADESAAGESAADERCAGHGLSEPGDFAAVRELATVDLKAKEPGLLSFCQRHGIPLRVIAKRQIEARSWVSQPSEWVRQSVGLDGVCEPCALIASTRGRLVVPKTTLDGVAVAIVADEWELGS
jgi:cobalamin biosynthesis protein CbiG